MSAYEKINLAICAASCSIALISLVFYIVDRFSKRK